MVKLETFYTSEEWDHTVGSVLVTRTVRSYLYQWSIQQLHHVTIDAFYFYFFIFIIFNF